MISVRPGHAVAGEPRAFPARNLSARTRQSRVPRSLRATAAAALAIGFGVTAPIAMAEDCPNTAVRTGLSAGLPDCRAYELVSPTDKVFGVRNLTVAAGATADGEHMAFATNQAVSDRNSVWPIIYRADRTATGWKTVAPDPTPSLNGGTSLVHLTNDLALIELTSRAYSPDDQDVQPGFSGGGSLDVYKIGAAGEVSFLSDGELNPLDVFAVPNVMATTADGSHVVFTFDDPLLSADVGRQSSPGLYESTPQGLRLVGIDDSGARLTDGAVHLGSGTDSLHAMSMDGSKLFFTTSDGGTTSGKAGLYLRENGQHTIPIPATPSGANANATFLGATSDGSTAYFATSDSLSLADTDTDTDIYAYDVADEIATLVSVGTGTGSISIGNPVYANNDGSRVYFEVYGQLQPGLGIDNRYNTYVWDHGVIKLVAPAYAVAVSAYESQEQCSITRMTPDGRYLLFESAEQLTPDDQDSATDVFRYDAESGTLDRVSRGSAGGNADTGAYMNPQATNGAGNMCDDRELQVSHAISDDGRFVFFETQEQLVPTDTNAELDVYEYDAQTGETHLLSAGTGSDDSQLFTSTASGDEVFITTTDRLVPSDIDALRDVYAIRVNGGFPDPPAQPDCRDSDCQAAPGSTPVPPVVASVTFAGPGNAAVERSGSRTTPRVRIIKSSVRGTGIRLKVAVPAAGRISASGPALRGVTRTLRHAGTCSLSVRLTGKAEHALRHKHRLRLRVRVGFFPSAGKASSVTVTIQVRK